jgi:carbon-monoxide dehydrogenase medium subunit
VPKPIRPTRSATFTAAHAAHAAARAACKPIDDKRGTIDFRIKVAGVLARRAAAIAFKRAAA